jgi:transcriptional regulator with XRE-family HTH domain
MTIADNLKKQRGDMSQSELARQSGVSQKTISAIEKGRIKYPTYQTAFKLAEVLACDPDEFLDNKFEGIKVAKKIEAKKPSKLLALKNKLGGS